MKNATKLLTLVLALPLLAGCGKVREPKFKQVGDQVEFEDFFAAYQLRLSEIDLAKEDLIGSKELITKAKGLNTKTLTRTGNTISKIQDGGTGSINMCYDAESRVLFLNEKTDYTSTTKDRTDNKKDRIKVDGKRYYQSYTADSKEYVISVDPDLKGFEKEYECTETLPYGKYIDMYAKESLGYGVIEQFSKVLADYQSSTEEKKECYSFFKNGNILTITFHESDSEDLKTSGDEVYAAKSVEEETKVQLELGDDELSSMYYTHRHTVTSYSKDHEDYTSLDTETLDDATSHVTTLKNSKKKVKAVDVSNYIKYGTDW